ncbi:MAG TPA: cation diffusion facilitator family transporter [Dehalococcoidia bacterium]|nr:cation diffusion facilitator family transporter [Dehalococcoidia bacterium]
MGHQHAADRVEDAHPQALDPHARHDHDAGSHHDHHDHGHHHDDHGQAPGHAGPERVATASRPALSAEEASQRGIRATKISLVLLGVTALLQGAVALFSGSAALLADTLHNVGDAFTAIPLWIAFRISQRPANREYTHGYHRSEDLAGIVILLFILLSAVIAAWESIHKLLAGETPQHIEWALAAALLGLIGNEAVAHHRIKVGKEIGSAALIADGQHARTDGLTSLGAFLGLLGAFFGLGWADGVAGLIIAAAILFILWGVGRDLIKRMMDAVDPAVIRQIEQIAQTVPTVEAVHDIRARWRGHRIVSEIHLGLPGQLTLIEAHQVAEDVRHKLLHEVENLADVIVHTDPGPDEDAYHETTAHHFEAGAEPAPTFRATHSHGPGGHGH